MRTFQHPGNGHMESVDGRSSLLALLLGPFYLASRELWGHAIIWTAIVCSAGINGGPLGAIVSSAMLSIGYAIAAQFLISNAYLRAGWTEIEEKVIRSARQQR